MTERPLPAAAFVPARRAPVLYFALAHLSLLLALALLALEPSELGGFYYHPRLVAVVHLVTLGFLTSSILGALYLVCPLALRLPLPEGSRDVLAFGSWAIAVAGVASHFWLERYSGMAWAGGVALLTPLWLGARVIAGLRRARLPVAVKLALTLAFLNLLLAGAFGVMLGIHKHAPFLPLPQLAGVHAHLHLAALGWALMMVLGAGFRILPMVLPAAMPGGAGPLASVLLLEAGALALFATLAFAAPLVPAAALLAVLGVAAFISRVVWMLRHRRPAPTGRPRAEPSVGHVLQAFAYLVLALALGLYLAVAEPAEATLRVAMAYGVFGLVGCLAQLVVGVEARIVGMAAWLQGYVAREYREEPPSLHGAASLPLQLAGLALWAFGVPLLAAGLALDRPSLTSAAAVGLALAVILNGTNLLRILRRLA